MLLRVMIGGMLVFGWSMSLCAQPAKRFVELELLASSNMVVGGQQTWLERLSDIGADRLTIKGNPSGIRPKIEEFERGDTVTIVVTGVLTDREIQLPGGRFGPGQIEDLKAYLQKLRDDGSRVALADKKAFGLTSEQLVEIHDELSRVVDFNTSQLTIRDFVQQTGDKLRTPLVISPAARQVLAEDERLGVELQGLTSGTALAYAIRSLGLVLVPRREQGKSVELAIIQVETANEHWPVGWPVEPPVNQNAPVLFERMDFDVRAFPLADVLTAVQRRMRLPFLIDENSLAEKNIDLRQTKVTYSRPQAPYLLALDAILRQTRPALQVEPRQDENGTVFLWIY